MAAYVYCGEPGRGFEPGETYHLAHAPTDDRWQKPKPSKETTKEQAATAATDEETP